MLFTRKGDDGTSGLFGTTERFSKDSAIYEAIGTLDELNSLLGVCLTYVRSLSQTPVATAEALRTAQERLFIIQAELAGANKTIVQPHVEQLESIVVAIEECVGNPHSFIIAGATRTSALLDYARAVSRRAERRTTAVQNTYPLSPQTKQYLNRLSSLLYALARYTAYQESVQEISPSY